MHVNVSGVRVPALQERGVASTIVYPPLQAGVHDFESAIVVAPSPHADAPETVGAVQPASFHIKMESSTAHFTSDTDKKSHSTKSQHAQAATTLHEAESH